MQTSTTNSNSRIANNPSVAYRNLRDSISSHDPIRWESRFRAFRASLEAFEQPNSDIPTAYIKCRYGSPADETDLGIALDMKRYGWEIGVSLKPERNKDNATWIAYKRKGVSS